MPPSVRYEHFMSRATRDCGFQCMVVGWCRAHDFAGIRVSDRLDEDLGSLGLRECDVIAFDVEMEYS